MGDQYPSLAPPYPQKPGLGFAVFCTSPSLDWVSPVAPAENTVWAMQYVFFSLDFSSLLPLNCTLGFYPPLGPPHCDLIVCLLEMCAGQNLQEWERKETRSRLKKIFLIPIFFRFFSFLERVFPLFPIFLGISHPVLRRSFPFFHLSTFLNPFLVF